MRAYKFTGPGAVGVFSGFRWPTPSGAGPGAWVEVDGSVNACERGVHACRTADLPYWIARELWEIELDDMLLEEPYKVVARRGRLLRRVPRWPELELPFARACAERARDLAADQLRGAGHPDLADQAASATSGDDWTRLVEATRATTTPMAATLARFAADCFRDIDRDYFTMCAYVAATAFGCASTGDIEQDMTSAGWEEERARQAGWLTEHLALA